MINPNAELSKAETNAKIIDHMDNAQAIFMAARTEKNRAKKMKMTSKQN